MRVVWVFCDDVAHPPVLAKVVRTGFAGDFLQRDCCEAREALRADFAQGGVLRLASKSLVTALAKLSKQALIDILFICLVDKRLRVKDSILFGAHSCAVPLSFHAYSPSMLVLNRNTNISDCSFANFRDIHKNYVDDGRLT